MKNKPRPPIWFVPVIALFWISLAANIVYDYVQEQRVTPFSILLVLSQVVGLLIIRIFKLPLYSPKPASPVIIMVIMFVVMFIYFVLRVYVL